MDLCLRSYFPDAAASMQTVGLHSNAKISVLVRGANRHATFFPPGTRNVHDIKDFPFWPRSGFYGGRYECELWSWISDQPPKAAEANAGVAPDGE
jgi:hypothetical protein